MAWTCSKLMENLVPSLEEISIRRLNTQAARTLGLKWVFYVLVWMSPVEGEMMQQLGV